MDFQITIIGKRDLSAQIYRAIREGILGGRLHAGQVLPSTRDLAAQLRVARKTVLRAYERLRGESLIEGATGSSTRVSSQAFITKTRRTKTASSLRLRKEPPGDGADEEPQGPSPYDFSVGTPDLTLFPFALWRSLLASSGRVLGSAQGGYTSAQGDLRLREAIAQYAAFTRAVVCRPDQIVITHGAQQAIDLLARVMLRPGDTVAVEEPGYGPVRNLLRWSGYEVIGVRVDSDGLCVNELPEKARLVYVTPSHQFPLGMPMSLERKLQLLRWASQHGACIVEDDYDSEYRFDPRPLESLQSLDKHGTVAYVGTFSKLMFPGLRIGFIAAPQILVRGLVAARRLTDWQEPLLTQHALTRFLTEGHLARHVRRMAKMYGRRRATLLDELRSHSDIWGTVIPSVAGLHVACIMRSPRQEKRVMQTAQASGVRLSTLSRYTQARDVFGVVLGYGGIRQENIRPAFRRFDTARV